jgi:signal transduction histidine kinase
MLSRVSAPAPLEAVPALSAVKAQLDATSAGIVCLDGDGRITYMNRFWRQFVEANQDEASCVGVGANYLDACQRSGHAWAKSIVTGIRSVIAKRTPFFEASYTCHSPNQLRWFRLQAAAPAEEGAGAAVITHTDITAQRIAEARSRILGCVADSFTGRKSLMDACRELALVACQELSWDYTGVWLLDSASWTLRCEDTWTRPELNLAEFERVVRGSRLAPGVGLPGKAWSTRKGAWVTDLDRERLSLPDGPARTTMPPYALAAGFRSGFAFAIKYDDDVLAVIDVFGRVRQAPDPGLLRLLEMAGVQLATAELRERTERRAEAAQAEADAAREELEAVLQGVPALVMAIDRDGAVRTVNRPAPAASDPGSWKSYVAEVACADLEHALEVALAGGPSRTYDVTVTEPGGKTTWFTHYVGPIGSAAHVTGALFVAQDVTQMKRAEHELFGAQRLAALGTLAAGVAHEINTPIQFVGDSVDFLRDASQDVFALVDSLHCLRDAVDEGGDSHVLTQLLAAAREAEERADLEYLRENVPKAFDRCGDGLERVTSIVRSMKEFSHPAEKDMAPVDLNRAIMATLTVARNEYKYVADMSTELGELPPVVCYVNDINQVVLNIVVNAAHAIADVIAGTEQRGTITVRTYVEAEHAVIAIADTGGGIPEHVRHRIFDPFFTTKEVGRGTGQGLAISWTAVKEKHAGELFFETKLGHGTTFFIRLPIAGKLGAGG